jgi:hypothetical protein
VQTDLDISITPLAMPAPGDEPVSRQPRPTSPRNGPKNGHTGLTTDLTGPALSGMTSRVVVVQRRECAGLEFLSGEMFVR